LAFAASAVALADSSQSSSPSVELEFEVAEVADSGEAWVPLAVSSELW
jgi:hypothetical protein